MLGHGLSTGLFNAILDDEFMNLSHIGTVPITWAYRNLGVCSRELLEGYLIL
jgi:hypothetical protein